MEVDEDVVMLSGAHQSQFTQSLLLFVSTIIAPINHHSHLILSRKLNQADVTHLILPDSTPLSRPPC